MKQDRFLIDEESLKSAPLVYKTTNEIPVERLSKCRAIYAYSEEQAIAFLREQLSRSRQEKNPLFNSEKAYFLD